MYSSSDYRSGECGTLGCDAQDSSAGAGPNTSDTLQSSHGLPHQTTRKALLILPSPRAVFYTFATIWGKSEGRRRELSSSPLWRGTMSPRQEPPLSDLRDVTRRGFVNTGTWVQSSWVPVWCPQQGSGCPPWNMLFGSWAWFWLVIPPPVFLVLSS